MLISFRTYQVVLYARHPSVKRAAVVIGRDRNEASRARLNTVGGNRGDNWLVVYYNRPDQSLDVLANPFGSGIILINKDDTHPHVLWSRMKQRGAHGFVLCLREPRKAQSAMTFACHVRDLQAEHTNGNISE